MLAAILEAADVRAAEAQQNMGRLVMAAQAQDPARGFARALGVPGLSVIAEIKKRSPSAGDINPILDPVARAVAYEAGGADAISVLTEPDFFGGSLDDLVAVRDSVSIPVLRKDFTRNEAQVWEARAAGADAVLIIVATLDQGAVTRLIDLSRDIGIDAIVEVHDADEVVRADVAGASIIGVNNRDLATFRTDLVVAEKLAPQLPQGVLSIGESGVSSFVGASRMRTAGYDAILVGEALVRSADPTSFVTALKESA
jgi:indole-3-glycerol phosphate synthase